MKATLIGAAVLLGIGLIALALFADKVGVVMQFQVH